MKISISHPQKTVHFKEWSRQLVREKGIEGSVDYLRAEKEKYKNNMYKYSFLKIAIFNMCIDFIVNELA